ncbi:MAG TPA: pitrilysin family protein [Gemmatimonadaceae bacterium]|nr:pitrilysin family protein [Gemmatimonadaceae bacterium]
MKRLTPFVALATLALSAVPAVAQAPRETPPAPGVPKDFVLPTLRSFSLPNGLEVTMAPYGLTPKVAIRLVVRTGNVDETAETVWLADLTRDLMLEGTTTRTAQQIAEEAARYGGPVGFSVGMNESGIGGDVLTEHGPAMLRLIADVVRNPRFPESELARLKANRVRQVTVSKTRQQSLANEKFLATLFPGHPYGRLFPTDAQLQGYTVDQVRAFHAANYGARRSHLYVVGRFDAAAMEAAIRQSFGDWQPGTAPAFNPPTPKTARAIHIIDRPGAVQSTIYLGLPVVDPSHPDYVALRVTDAILGGSFGSRITSNIREQKGYTYSPFSTVNPFLKNAYWAEIADVTTNVTGPSLKEIFFEIDRLQAEPPTAAELESIKKYLAGIFVLQNSSRLGIIGQLQFTELHGLGENYLRELVRKIYAVTPADVQRIAREYLRDDTMTIVIAGDRRQIEEQIKPFGNIVND